VIAGFDQIGLVHYRLYREHHRLEGDVHLKDLEFLNRPVTNVVVLESNMQRMKTHPDNGLPIKTWTGEEGDEELKKWMKTLHGIMVLFRNDYFGCS
jgi:import inner membrane translocase subunit TIM50